jgi:uncharacterized OsmC-like protein
MTTPPKQYRVHGSSASGGTAAIVAGDQTIPIDAMWAAEEPSGLPGPAELLASAFAACILKNLERAGAMMPFEYTSAEVEVTARRQDAPPRFVEIEYAVRIVTGESPRRLELLHRNLSQFGTVYNTLAAVCDVHGTVVAVGEPTVVD